MKEWNLGQVGNAIQLWEKPFPDTGVLNLRR